MLKSMYKNHIVSGTDYKPLLRKKGKQWIVVGMSALALIGLSGLARVNAHASTNTVKASINHSLTNKTNSNAKGIQATKTVQQNTTNINNQASALHNRIVANQIHFTGTQSASNNKASVASNIPSSATNLSVQSNIASGASAGNQSTSSITSKSINSSLASYQAKFNSNVDNGVVPGKVSSANTNLSSVASLSNSSSTNNSLNTNHTNTFDKLANLNKTDDANTLIHFHDIYNDFDKFKAPKDMKVKSGQVLPNFKDYAGEFVSDASDAYDDSDRPDSWVFVNSQGQIVKNPIASGTNQIINVAPTFDGMIYKYNKAKNSVEFTGGSLDWNGTNVTSNYDTSDGEADSDPDNLFGIVQSNDGTNDPLADGTATENLASIKIDSDVNTSKPTNAGLFLFSDYSIRHLTLPSNFGQSIKKANFMIGPDLSQDNTVITLNNPSNYTSAVKSELTSLKLYRELPQKDNNGDNYTTEQVDFNNGNPVTGNYTFHPNVNPAESHYVDIFGSSDGLKLPAGFGSITPANKIQNSSDASDEVSSGWTYVDKNGDISNTVQKDDNGKIMVAPFNAGLTYHLNTKNNTIEYIDGTMKISNGSNNIFTNIVNPYSSDNSDYEIDNIKFDKGINTNSLKSSDMSDMFSNHYYLTNITGMSDWNVKNVTSLHDMFRSDSDLNPNVLNEIKNWEFNSKPNTTGMVYNSKLHNGKYVGTSKQSNGYWMFRLNHTTPAYNFSSASNAIQNDLAKESLDNYSINTSKADSIESVASGYASSADNDTNSSAITNQSNNDSNSDSTVVSLSNDASNEALSANSYINDLKNDSSAVASASKANNSSVASSAVSDASNDVKSISSANTLISNDANSANNDINKMSDSIINPIAKPQSKSAGTVTVNYIDDTHGTVHYGQSIGSQNLNNLGNVGDTVKLGATGANDGNKDVLNAPKGTHLEFGTNPLTLQVPDNNITLTLGTSGKVLGMHATTNASHILPANHNGIININ